MVKNPLDETTSMKQLENEAKNVANKPGTRMYEYLQRARKLNKCVLGMTSAECLVVTMYTDDSSDKAFYNMASTNRIWQPYRVYTTLLVSAIRKLAKIDPIPRGTTLYRGISFRPERPNARRLFWKAASSASLNFQTARGFAGSNGVIFRFQPPASRYAAQVRKLSFYSSEDEVILLPFEVFDLVATNAREFCFKSSVTQELLNPKSPWNHDELREIVI